MLSLSSFTAFLTARLQVFAQFSFNSSRPRLKKESGSSYGFTSAGANRDVGKALKLESKKVGIQHSGHALDHAANHHKRAIQEGIDTSSDSINPAQKLRNLDYDGLPYSRIGTLGGVQYRFA